MCIFQSVRQCIKVAFQSTCVLMAIYYSTLQGERYFRNEDASVISFRKFNQRPQDNYPDFTFCIEGGHLHDFSKELGLPIDNLTNVLKGNVDRELSASEEKILTLHPDQYFKSLSDILIRYRFTTNKNTTYYNKGKKVSKVDKEEMDRFFSKIHQDPDKQCFTRHSKFEKDADIVRTKDEFALNVKSSTKMTIFLHLPGQFIKHIDFPNDRQYDGSLNTFIIPSMTILRKRSTQYAPCSEATVDYGSTARLKIFEKEKCIPLYWKSLVKENISQEICTTQHKLRKLYDLIQNMNNLDSSQYPPCTAMIIPLSVQKLGLVDKYGKLGVSVLYPITEYQEILNVRAFDFDSMFSGIGGFIGIFLGYSLLQVADLIKCRTLEKLATTFSFAASNFHVFWISIFSKG